jgi:hypothetical protein
MSYGGGVKFAGCCLAVIVLAAATFPGPVRGARVHGIARSGTTARVCDDILSLHAFYSVTVRAGSSCSTARRVLHTFMGGGGVAHGGPAAYQQWWSVAGWRCGYGAGGGACLRSVSGRRARASIVADWLAWECGYKPQGATVPCADTPQDSVRAVARARFHVRPLWPTYLPAVIRDGTWNVSNLRGRQPEPRYPDVTASGSGAFRVDFGYPVQPGAFGGGEFARTSAKVLAPAILASRVNFPPRHLKLGGRNVVEFRLHSTATQWAFSGPGGYYVFASKDFGGPSKRTIGRMIASLRPIPIPAS